MPTDSAKTPDQNGTAFPGNIAFAPALLDPDLDIPAGLVGPTGKPAPKRFSVYRNNVVVSLMEAMGETYPSVKKLIGEENFATTSRIYISNHPPSSPMMQNYGDLFPQFLETFEPLQHAPFLIDVAKLEMSWIKAYHAGDEAPYDGALLAQIDPDELMETCFTPHPATHLISSNYNLLDMFSVRNDDNTSLPDHSKNDTMQAVLVTRPQLKVELSQLDHAQNGFFTALISQQSLGESVETALQIDENFDASKAITIMLSSGAFTTTTVNT